MEVTGKTNTNLKNIAVLGTLDSKGHEHAYIAKKIRELGHTPLLIDVGSAGEPQITPDFTRYDVARVAGTDLTKIHQQQDRGACVSAMAEATPFFIKQLYDQGKIDGIISLGGGGGTAIATSAMRALPIGFPKVMVSTLASGNTAHYVGSKDIVMIPSIVDIAGLNSISKMIFTRATGAICGMVETELHDSEEETSKPIIAASMFGNTTECINRATEILTEAGYEVLIFHATGSGGKTMEALIESGQVVGVLDVTTTEWADEITGATLSAGPTRMDAMTTMSVPAVIAPGCLDMANFGEFETIPDRYKKRNLYVHNPQVTLMRTNAEECRELGKIISQKANTNTAPTAMMIPNKGVSIISQKGQPFYNAEADSALFSSIQKHYRGEIIELDCDINDPTFAERAAQELINLIQSNKK